MTKKERKRLHLNFCTLYISACQTVKKATVTWIFMWLVALALCVLLVPVQDAANEGRYESHLGLGAGHSLSE